jgi:hypothetical protein
MLSRRKGVNPKQQDVQMDETAPAVATPISRNSAVSFQQAKAVQTSTMLVFPSVALSGGSLLLTIVLLLMSAGNASKPVPVYVQTTGGGKIGISAQQGLSRSNELIQSFVSSTLAGLCTWQEYVITNPADPSTAKKDPGVPVTYKDKTYNVPTNVWKASYRLSNDSRDAILAAVIIPLIDASGAMQGQSTIAYVPQHVPKPEEITDPNGEKLWLVRAVGSLVLRDTRGVRTVPFNRNLTIRAIEPPVAPPAVPDKLDLATVVAEERSQGLEVVRIEAYTTGGFIKKK